MGSHNTDVIARMLEGHAAAACSISPPCCGGEHILTSSEVFSLSLRRTNTSQTYN